MPSRPLRRFTSPCPVVASSVESLIDSTANIRRKLRPLTRACGREDDRLHALISHIAILMSRHHNQIAIAIAVALDALTGHDGQGLQKNWSRHHAGMKLAVFAAG